MMKTRIAVVAVALSFAAAAASFAANPQMGTWKLNEAKSKLVPGMGKNTTVVYAEQGDKIKVTVDGVDKDGKPTHSVWVGKWDGKAYPTKGNLSWNSAAYKVVNDRTNDITTFKDGKVVWIGQNHRRGGWQIAHGHDERHRRGRKEVQRQGRLRQVVGRPGENPQRPTFNSEGVLSRSCWSSSSLERPVSGAQRVIRSRFPANDLEPRDEPV